METQRIVNGEDLLPTGVAKPEDSTERSSSASTTATSTTTSLSESDRTAVPNDNNNSEGPFPDENSCSHDDDDVKLEEKEDKAVNIPRFQTLDAMFAETGNDNTLKRIDKQGKSPQNNNKKNTSSDETRDQVRAPIPRFQKPKRYGARRISEHLNANQKDGKVYGNWQERDQLVGILKRSSGGTAKAEVVMITGALGVGKTALARTLKNPMVLNTGNDDQDGTPDPNIRPSFFLEAKFEHLRSPNPYQIFVDIFEDFAEQVQAHPELNTYRMALWEACHEDMDLVVNLIPAFRAALSSNHCDMDASETSASKAAAPSGALMAQRVTTLFSSLLKTIASVTPSHPLVVCLDDLHWSSEAAFDTLVCIIKDMDLSSAGSILFVTNRRTCIAGHCSFCPYKGLKGIDSVQLHMIEMQNLSEHDVFNILKDTIKSACMTIQNLSKVVYSVTQGNPMFITEVLRTLQDEGLVYEYDGSAKWGCDIPKIQASLDGLTFDDLISNKLHKLQSCTLRTLTRASFLGTSQIDEAVLSLLEPENTKKSLQCAIDAGYVRQNQDGSYQFVSDGVQHCIYHRLPEEDRAAFHLEIAQVLWSHLEERKDKEFLFLLLNQLMMGDSLLKEDADRLAVATLSLRAGESSAKKMGFQTAWVYLKHGLSLLPREKMWGRDSYDLCLRLHNASIEVCYVAGKFDVLDELIEAILKNSRVFEDSLLARSTQIYALGSRNKLPQALESALSTLKELGEVIPAHPSQATMRGAFRRTKKMLHSLSDEYILRMEPMKGRRNLGTMQILNHMFLYAYYSRPSLAALVACRMVQLTLSHGTSAISAVAFSFYCQFVCSNYSVVDGYRYGKLAMKLYEKFESEAWLSRVWSFYYGAVASWKEPLPSTLEPLQHGFKVGLRTGDIEYALLNGSYYCWSCVELLPLPQLRCEIQKVVTMMETTGHKMALSMLQPIYNFVLNMSKGPDGHNRRDEFLDLVQRETRAALESSNEAVALWYRASTVISAYYYGDYPLGARHMDGISKLYETHKYCGVGAICVLFFECMTILALAKKKSVYKRIRDLSYVQKRVKQLEEWAHDAPENLLDKLHLLKGELAVVRGDVKKANQHLRAGILSAESEGHLSNAALGKERLALFLAAQGEEDKAERLLQEASVIYEKWGAKAKAWKVLNVHKPLFPAMSDMSEALPSTVELDPEHLS